MVGSHEHSQDVVGFEAESQSSSIRDSVTVPLENEMPGLQVGYFLMIKLTSAELLTYMGFIITQLEILIRKSVCS